MELETKNNNALAYPVDTLFMLACPFCGEIPEVEPPEENYGTWYEIDCVCGMAKSGVDISDLLSRDENADDEFIDGQFKLKYRERARDYCVKQWNTRAT